MNYWAHAPLGWHGKGSYVVCSHRRPRFVQPTAVDCRWQSVSALPITTSKVFWAMGHYILSRTETLNNSTACISGPHIAGASSHMCEGSCQSKVPLQPKRRRRQNLATTHKIDLPTDVPFHNQDCVSEDHFVAIQGAVKTFDQRVKYHSGSTNSAP